MIRIFMGGFQRLILLVLIVVSTSIFSSLIVIILDDILEEVVMDNIELFEYSLLLVCLVFYCEVLFIIRDKLEQYMRDFDYCLINFCMVNFDGVLVQYRFYLCTSCNECFRVSKVWIKCSRNFLGLFGRVRKNILNVLR